MASMVCSGSAPHPVADACWFPCWREHAGSAGARERGSAGARAESRPGLKGIPRVPTWCWDWERSGSWGWILGLRWAAHALGSSAWATRARERGRAPPLGPDWGPRDANGQPLRACQEVFKVVGFFERAIFVFLRFSFKTKTSRFSLKHTSVF
jgi:hypothetical protein